MVASHPSKEQDMVSVKVQAEGGRYSTVLKYDSGYTFVGEEFEAGKPVLGDFEGHQKALADAQDWREKLARAGLTVEG
jgi:hypothetical protein